ncbi:MAG: SpoIIE family protein phosphatase [Treponema sp.]|jgi:sigma-B regulation protein RsbU (phosphoserine phosphatase)|nr:SpoIIE family protein phosphatase [Treponema sp.]
MAKQIRGKVLQVILSTSLGVVLLVSITAMVSIFYMRNMTLVHNDYLGDTAAENSKKALVSQVQQQLIGIAQDKAALTDEKLRAIQNQTKMIAAIATNIFTHKNQYSPKAIDYLHPEQAGMLIPHVATAPGVSIADFRNEIYLAANIGDILRQITVIDIGVGANYIGAEAGYSIIVQGNAHPNMNNYDARTRDWYRGAKEKDGIFWTNVFADALGRGAAISCAIPFYDLSSGERVFKGVAGSGFRLSTTVNQIIDSTKISETSYAFLLNEKGHVILTPKPDDIIIGENGVVIGKDYLGSEYPEPRELARRMVNHESGLMELELDGKAVYVAFHPLSVLDWSLGVVVPIEEIIAPAKSIQQDILSLSETTYTEINHIIFIIVLMVIVVIVLSMLITIFLAIRLSDSLTAPIIMLSKGAKIIGSGELNHQLVVKTGDEIEMLANTFNQMIEDIKHITAEKERIGVELNVATKIQASMLPSIFPPFPDREEFDIYAEMHPAKEVGGDFYDFFLIGEKTLAVVIADVSGKGVPAALFMVIVKTLIKNQAQMGKSLDEIFYSVNNQLCENNDASMFVTTFMGLFEIDTGKFSYVNGGHNPPVIRQEDGEFTWLKTKPGLVLATMENMKYMVMETTLKEKDILFLYTDGVNEAMNTQEEFFGNQRILDVLNADGLKNSTIHDYINAMLDAIKVFANGAEQADDITMLMLQCRSYMTMITFDKELRLSASIDELDTLLEWIGDILEQGHCTMKVCNQVAVVVEELFVNIAWYAYRGQPGEVLIRVAVGESQLVMQFEDSGVTFNPLEHSLPDIKVGIEERKIGGLGIYMTRKMMDKIIYARTNDRNQLTLYKNIKLVNSGD